jgi:formate/nitrite transporter
MVMALAGGRLRLAGMLRAWAIIYLGNFVGALGTAVLVFLSGHAGFGDGAVGRTALAVATAKAGIAPVEGFFLGILCNVLVCLAVWLSLSARSVADKVLAVVPPTTAFVAAGFEHSVANMYFIPFGLLLRGSAEAGPDLLGLITNLVPVTLGNIVGGAVLVGAVYWFVYLRRR